MRVNKSKSYLKRNTKRLIIRPLGASDYFPWKSAYENMLPHKNSWDRLSPKFEDLSRAKFSKLLRQQKKLRDADRFFDLAIFRKDTKEFIGLVSIMDVVRGLMQSCFIGYRIFNRHWAKGYGKEATAALIDIAFKDLKLHRVEAGIHPYNRRSIMLARSLGLRKEGLKKKAVFLEGKWMDLAMYSGTCEEFGVKWRGKINVRLR